MLYLLERKLLVMLKGINITLLLLLIMLSWHVSYGDGSIGKIKALRTAMQAEQTKLATMDARNRDLLHEIEYLKQYPEAVEESARYELGMIKRHETYYQVVEPIE